MTTKHTCFLPIRVKLSVAFDDQAAPSPDDEDCGHGNIVAAVPVASS
jgi:hypothetical protein